MSHGQKSLLLWAALILLLSYLMGINIAGFISGVIHAAQTIHSQNAH